MFEINKSNIEPNVLWTKEKILDNVSQEQIIEYYLNVKVQYKKSFKSPLRTDENPTCTFKRTDNNVILFRDWADTKAKDCFGIVQDMFHVDFKTALQIIARDMNLTTAEPSITKKYRKEEFHSNKPVYSEKSIIKVKTKKFTEIDKEYLSSYHITKEITNHYNVFGIYTVWLNGKLVYVYDENNPAIAYYFGKDNAGNDKWKIYYYKNRKFRFIGNTNRINGWIQIPKKGRFLVITKSMKDVMCLSRFSIPAVSMQAETQIPYDYIIEELQSRYDEIFTLFDFDLTGVRSANKIRKLYGIKPLFLTNGRFGSRDFGYKDFSDYLQANGIESAYELISEALFELNIKHYVKTYPNINHS